LANSPGHNAAAPPRFAAPATDETVWRNEPQTGNPQTSNGRLDGFISAGLPQQIDAPGSHRAGIATNLGPPAD
jgi:hypothetical protein